MSASVAIGADYIANGSSMNVNGSNNGVPNPTPEIAGEGSTLTIEAGATITLHDNDTNGAAFKAAPNSRILNLGTIGGGADYANSQAFWGLIVFDGSNGASVINHGVIDLIDDSGASGIVANWDGSLSTNLFLSNDGMISLSSTASRGIYAVNAALSEISNSGQIRSDGDGGRGVSVGASNGAQIHNSGTISVQGDGDYGVYVTLGSNDVIVTNSGTISVSGDSPFGIATLLDSEGTQITNTGTVVATGPAARGIAAFGNSDNAAINNGGMVYVDGDNSFGLRLRDSVGSTITNSGLVRGTGFGGAGISVYAGLDGTGGVVTNSGTVLMTSTGSAGVRFEDVANGSGVRSLTNSGTIFAATTADKAINFATSGTDDSLTLLGGTRLQGRIEMNGGTDTVVLDHTGDKLGWRFTLDHIASSEITVLGGPYVIEQPGDSVGGVTITVADVSREGAAAGQLAQLTNAVGWGVFNDLLIGGTAAPDRDIHPWARSFADLRANRDGWSNIAGGAFGADAEIDGRGSRAGALIGIARSSLNTGDGAAVTNTGIAGLYGHAAINSSFFADLLVLGGYGDGEGQSRQRANNLVTGGIETVTGSSTSGAFGAVQGRIGGYLPVGPLVLAPSLSAGYAHQWRNGYTESGTSMGAYGVDVLTARLELAALTPGDGPLHGTMRVGVEGELDMGPSLDMRLGGVSAASFHLSSQQRADGFLGAGLQAELGANLRLSADIEGRTGLAPVVGPGARASVGLSGRF